MSKLLDVPVFIEAPTKEDLIRKMIDTNTLARYEFKYFDIQKDGNKWVAWFYVDGVNHVNLIKSIIDKKKVIKKKASK